MATKTKTSKEPVATKAAVPADAAREAHDHMKSEPERHAGNQPLTLKQQRFVEEMLVDLNATAAYRRAGYAARGNAAEVNAARLLRNAQVARAVAKALRERQARTAVTQDMVVSELAALAFLDVRRLFDADGKPIPVFQLDAATARDIQALDVATNGNADVGLGKVTKLRFADKLGALELLGKHLGMWKQGPIDITVDMQSASSAAVAAMMAQLFAPPRAA